MAYPRTKGNIWLYLALFLADKKCMRSSNGNIQIVRPPKLFLDTNHLINIAKLRKSESLPSGQSLEAYSFIDRCIGQHYGIIFSQSAPLDWVDGNATESSARKIAQVIDSAKLKYLLELDAFVYLSEVLDECHRLHPELCVPQLNILHLVSDGGSYEPAELKIAVLAPDYFRNGAQAALSKLIESNVTRIPIVSVERLATETVLWKKNNPQTYRKRVEGFKDMLSEDIEGAGEYFADPARFHVGWLSGFLQVNKILTACNDGLSADDVADILRGLDLKRCSSVWLYIQAHEHRMRAVHPPTDNEVDDWFILPAVLYADLILVDRGFRDIVIRADRSLTSKVFSNASDAATALADF